MAHKPAEKLAVVWTASSLSAVATKTAVLLLAPNQDILYLRENIRSRLLVAAQAVPRHQEETYKQALDNVSTWVRAYYNTDEDDHRLPRRH